MTPTIIAQRAAEFAKAELARTIGEQMDTNICHWRNMERGYSQGYKDALEVLEKYQRDHLAELTRIVSNFEHIAELASKLTTGNVSHDGRTILGVARNNAEFIQERFINVITK
ncbi:MAG: hypothetical protein RSB32_07910 [Mucinivorans sp.]